MNLHTSSSLLDIISVALLAILGVIVFIVYPIVRYTSRPRHRRPVLTDGALCRRLRRLGHDLTPPSDEQTRAAIAATRAELIRKLTGGTVL